MGAAIAAATLAVVIWPAPAAAAPALSFPNTPPGWQHRQAALAAQRVHPATAQVVMEATGASWHGLATTLVAAGWPGSVVAPASARHDAPAPLRRAKTAAVDAAVRAAYGRDLRPARWVPAPAAVQALQVLIRQRDDLVTRQTETRTRRHALSRLPTVPTAAQAPLTAVLAGRHEQIAALDEAIRRHAAPAAAVANDSARLQTIVGVGLLTAAGVVAAAPRIGAGATPAPVVACAGLDPARREAGRSVRGAGHSSTTGNARLRPAVYRAAVRAARSNPVRRAFYARLVARGTPKKVARVAGARTLLVLMVTLLRRERDFDPQWEAKRHHP